MINSAINIFVWLCLWVMFVLMCYLVSEFTLQGGIKYYYNKFKTWKKIKQCRAKNHGLGGWRLIEKQVTSDWSEPRAGQRVRSVNCKFVCSNCKTVFIKNNQWDYKWENQWPVI